MATNQVTPIRGGLYIQTGRMKRQISQVVLAEEVGYSRSSICNWERGEQEPSNIAVDECLEALGYTRLEIEKLIREAA
jgi:DNA-binding transcriptional regulator YiaG